MLSLEERALHFLLSTSLFGSASTLWSCKVYTFKERKEKLTYALLTNHSLPFPPSLLSFFHDFLASFLPSIPPTSCPSPKTPKIKIPHSSPTNHINDVMTNPTTVYTINNVCVGTANRAFRTRLISNGTLTMHKCTCTS